MGGYNGTLILAPLTPGMIQYVRSYIFNGGFSADVTLMVWNRAEGWQVLNCKALWNDPAQSSQPGGRRGYLDLKINFVNGTIALLGNGINTESGLQLQLENGDLLLQE